MAVLTLLPAQTISPEPEPLYRVVSGVLVDKPEPPEHIKNPEVTYPGESCNCYAYTRNRISKLPPMDSVHPNAKPSVGAVAVEWFGKVKHVSIVTEVTDFGVTVKEANYTHCKKGTRFIPFDHYSLVGFWSPQ